MKYFPRNIDISTGELLIPEKMQGPKHKSLYFLKVNMLFYFCAKFQVSRKYSADFWEGGWRRGGSRVLNLF